MVIALFIDSVKENLPTTCKIQEQIIVCIWTHTNTQMNRHTHTENTYVLQQNDSYCCH